jgi:Leucine-rich repeat (LRR) protein
LALERFLGLTDLSLRENMGLTSIDLQRVSPLQRLTISSVSSNGQIAHPAVQLGGLKLMEELRVDGAILDSAALLAIGDAPRIWTLSLRNIKLTDSSSLRFGKDGGVINLCIRDSDFSDILIAGAERLRTVRISSNPLLTALRVVDLPRLEEVELADNAKLDLRRGLLNDLALLPQLRKLNLNRLNLRDKDLAVLKPLKTLESLNLSGCNLTGEGLAYLRELIPTCGVDLTHTPVSDEAVAALQKSVPGLTVKSEPKNPVVQDLRQQVALVRNRLAKGIECKMNPWKLADDDFACLEGLENLESLDLSDTHLTDAGLDHLRQLPKLRELIVQRTQLTDAAVRTLKQMPALVHVDIDGTRITAEGRRALGPLVAKGHAERD